LGSARLEGRGRRASETPDRRFYCANKTLRKQNHSLIQTRGWGAATCSCSRRRSQCEHYACAACKQHEPLEWGPEACKPPGRRALPPCRQLHGPAPQPPAVAPTSGQPRRRAPGARAKGRRPRRDRQQSRRRCCPWRSSSPAWERRGLRSPRAAPWCPKTSFIESRLPDGLRPGGRALGRRGPAAPHRRRLQRHGVCRRLQE
jgi:hypothetical protein